MKRKKQRGLGRTYQRGRIWWIRYSYTVKDEEGKSKSVDRRESSDSEDENVAIRLLQRRMGELGRGRLIGADAERLTFEDLAALLVEDYENNGRKSKSTALRTTRTLRQYFGMMRALDIPPKVGAYIKRRRDGGYDIERKGKKLKANPAKPATIQLELAALKRMFNLAYRLGQLPQRPYIPSIQVRNTRTGFFEEAELTAVMEHLKPHLRAVVQFAFLTGWRKAEILGLQWRQVDMDAQVIRLEPGTTKNDDGRTLPFSKYPTLAALLESQREHTKALERATARIIPNVFHRAGRPILDFREAWENACDKAKVSGRLFHDLRRTAVRNLERAGVPRSHAMKITGHKTEAIYRRYAIVNPADLEAVGEKLEQAAADRERARTANKA